jgi:primary-amine oxidase
MSLPSRQADTLKGVSALHPFDPLTPAEIKIAVSILEHAFPGVPLRYKRIDVLEPIKKDVVPYLDAELRGLPLPKKPARLLFSYFHRMDTRAFFKAVLSLETLKPVYVKELPKDIQVNRYYTTSMLKPPLTQLPGTCRY